MFQLCDLMHSERMNTNNFYITEKSILDRLPEPVSSSYGQTHAESPPQHPTGDCGPGTAGCLCRDPETEG